MGNIIHRFTGSFDLTQRHLVHFPSWRVVCFLYLCGGGGWCVQAQAQTAQIKLVLPEVGRIHQIGMTLGTQLKPCNRPEGWKNSTGTL